MMQFKQGGPGIPARRSALQSALVSFLEDHLGGAPWRAVPPL
jgi:hypothetical protein